jgi:hypothetical protein
MISALYGELTENEMREFEAALEDDEELRRDWEELRQARASLQQLAREDAAPEFTFRMPGRGPIHRTEARVVPLWRWALASAAGFAAAASIFLVLLVSGLRVDRTTDGVLVRLGGAATGGAATASDRAPGLTGTSGDFLTRAEFATFAEVLIDTTAVRLDELDRRQSSSRAEVARALYDALAVQQQRQYDDLSSQIQLALLRTGGSHPGVFNAPGMNSELEGNHNDKY